MKNKRLKNKPRHYHKLSRILTGIAGVMNRVRIPYLYVRYISN